MKNFKAISVILLLLLLLGFVFNLSKEREIVWDKNFSTEKKSPYGLWVFNEEASTLFHGQLEKIDQSPYLFYEKNPNIKPHNLLVIQSGLDSLSWLQIIKHVSMGANAMILAENFPKKLQDTLQIELSYFNNNSQSNLYLTDRKFFADSLVIDKDQASGIFTKINFNKTEILGKEYYEKSPEFKIQSAANFIKVNFGKGCFYLHAEPLMVTNYHLLKPQNQNYIQDVFSLLPNRKTYWFHSSYKEETSSLFPFLDFILSSPGLREAWYVFLFSILFFIIFNAKRKQRVIPIIKPLKNKSVEFIRTIGNLYRQEGDFHEMMAKKAHYFLSKVRTELLIDPQKLDEEFEKKLELKTNKTSQEIKKAVDLIKKSLDPKATVIQDDLIELNKALNKILK